jgi:hypothetical protein
VRISTSGRYSTGCRSPTRWTPTLTSPLWDRSSQKGPTQGHGTRRRKNGDDRMTDTTRLVGAGDDCDLRPQDVMARADSGEIAYSVSVREAAGPDLVDDALFPPLLLHRAWNPSCGSRFAKSGLSASPIDLCLVWVRLKFGVSQRSWELSIERSR